ncbi:MAG: YdeI/OmpD-associated family protein [Pseudomonadota bacterium]
MSEAHVTIRSLDELQTWLGDHHSTATSVWLVTFKKHHPDHVPFGDVVEELMCWGWVDSSIRRLDADRSMHLISPRRESSAWSAVNKAIVEKMRRLGRMMPAGEQKIAAAQENGMWSFLDDVERLECPADLVAALGEDGMTFWETYPRSVKRGTLEWIKTAKTAATRSKRIAEVEAACAENRRPAPFQR